jgi:hypothetical protein
MRASVMGAMTFLADGLGCSPTNKPTHRALPAAWLA